MTIQIKRVYDSVEQSDGIRVLVDRVWPRGVSKKQLQHDHWLKDVAPSTSLRKWFGHDRSKWEDFKTSYFSELDENPEPVQGLLYLASTQQLTLLFAAKDTEYNHAAALRDYLLAQEQDDHSKA
jgi:uncharacterized protein YeaO (DUF488 family)